MIFDSEPDPDPFHVHDWHHARTVYTDKDTDVVECDCGAIRTFKFNAETSEELTL